MSQKPAKFGIKFWMVCDAETYYVLQLFPYTGKTDFIEEGFREYVFIKLVTPYFNIGLNTITDKFFQVLLLPRSSINTI